MIPSASFQCFTLTLLVLPGLVLLLYVLTAFPHTPQPLALHNSLASLPKHSPTWSIYPEDIFTGGAYASFPFGRTRYWMLGPEDGIKLVLIHGLSVPSMIWQDVAPELAAKGFRVLVYDLYGRGYSDAPQTTYDVSLYVTQLALLLQYVGWDKADLAGISMGGAIAAAFSVQFPHLFTGRIALLATAGIVDSTDMSRTTRFLSSPLMQTVAATYPFRMYLRYLASSSAPLPTTPPGSPQEAEAQALQAFNQLVRLQSAHLPGYNYAIASSIRDGPIRGQAPVFAALGRLVRKVGEKGMGKEGKVLLVWGTNDTVVPYRYASRVHALLGTAEKELVTLEGAKHDLTVTHSERVVELLANFFGDAAGKAKKS